MRLLPGIILLLAAFYLPANAEIPGQPDHTFLWNDFDAVTIVDSFAIATNSNGIAVLFRNDVTQRYEQVTQQFLNARGITHKRQDSVLAVRTDADVIYFFNLSQLPSLDMLGTADVGQPFSDFAFESQNLYLAKEFEGLWRYQMTNYSDPQFSDSSMLGIHYVKVEIYDDGLYALDDYNGILRYDISGVGFGTFLNYLLIPFQATGFTRIDSTFYIPVTSQRLLKGVFGDGQPTVTDTIPLWFTPGAVYAQDTLAVVLTRSISVMDVINLNTDNAFTVQLVNGADSLLRGQIHHSGANLYFTLTTANGGLNDYNLTNITVDQGITHLLARPGAVVDVELRDTTLLTAGLNNPVDRYHLGTGAKPVFDTTFYAGIPEVRALESNGDTLFIYYSGLGRIFMIDTESDSLPFLGSIRPAEPGIREIVYNSHPFDSLHPFFGISEQTIELFSASDSGGIFKHQELSIVDQITAAAVQDSTLYVASGKTGVSLYHIFSDLDLEFRSNISLVKPAVHLEAGSSRLFVFTSDQMIVYNTANSSSPLIDTVISLPIGVSDTDIDNDVLYAIGESGIALWDLSTEHPQLIDLGGRPGYMISAGANGLVVTSDSNAVHVYDLRDIVTDVPENEIVLPSVMTLHQNYPNPFNPTTTISYSLARQSRVRLEIFNLLGRRVQMLVDTDQPAGEYSVVWDGDAASGQSVASGVYFYRLTAGDAVDSRKMLLLK